MKEVSIQSNYIQLDQFLKWAAIVQTGSHAKMLIIDGDVLVNGVQEIKRSRKLCPGDEISVKDRGMYRIVKE